MTLKLYFMNALKEKFHSVSFPLNTSDLRAVSKKY